MKGVALAFAGLLLNAAAQAAEPAPYMLTRSLVALQNQAAIGTLKDRKAQAQLLLRIGSRFKNAEPEVWNERRNARAAIVYVLAGGQPGFLSRWMTMEKPPLPRELIAGTLAYASAQRDIAVHVLTRVDPGPLPPLLGGHLALAQATLILDDNPEEALRLLRLARLKMPGTLVAEAAMRREVAVLSRLRKLDVFTETVARYFRRYGRSIYARDLIDRLASLMIRAATNERDALAVLEPLTQTLPTEHHRAFLLEVARLALIDGKMLLTNEASALVSRGLVKGTPSARRSDLYFAATAVTGDALAPAVEALQKMGEAPLPPADRALRAAALAVAEQLRRPSSEPGKPGAAGVRSAVVKRAEKALEATDVLLEESVE